MRHVIDIVEWRCNGELMLIRRGHVEYNAEIKRGLIAVIMPDTIAGMRPTQWTYQPASGNDGGQ
jgi:hypothetical protein